MDFGRRQGVAGLEGALPPARSGTDNLPIGRRWGASRHRCGKVMQQAGRADEDIGDPGFSRLWSRETLGKLV
jgi:hypothetical protein